MRKERKEERKTRELRGIDTIPTCKDEQKDKRWDLRIVPRVNEASRLPFRIILYIISCVGIVRIPFSIAFHSVQATFRRRRRYTLLRSIYA